MDLRYDLISNRTLNLFTDLGNKPVLLGWFGMRCNHAASRALCTTLFHRLRLDTIT